jgi:uncharacterized protein (TIGR02646 family)
MRAINKATEPLSLSLYRATPGSNYADYRDKQTLRELLVSEQRGLCCYCLCRISAGDPGTIPPMKIAHWHSQELHAVEQLDYSNLLGACMGNEGSPPSDQHCDTRQGKRDIKWNPANPDHQIESRIIYFADGRIGSSDTEFNQQIDEVLNLNKGFPKTNRKFVLDSFKQALERKEPSRAELERWLLDWNGESHTGELKPYCQVVVYWLRKRLRRP